MNFSLKPTLCNRGRFYNPCSRPYYFFAFSRFTTTSTPPVNSIISISASCTVGYLRIISPIFLSYWAMVIFLRLGFFIVCPHPSVSQNKVLHQTPKPIRLLSYVWNEDKIRAITCVTADAGFQLAYTNASVEYTDGKFWIISGSIGRYYTGSYRSSVKVASGSTNGCLATLGFNLPIDSQTIAGYTYPEAAVSSTYNGDATPLAIEAGTGVVEGNALCITGDGVNFEYFTALSGTTDTSIAVATSGGSEGYTAISGTYTANAAKVQILRPQDPNARPTSWFNSVDELIRYGVKGIVNQIDYSS